MLQLIVDGFAGSFGGRAHQDDDILGIFCAIIREQMVFAACYFRNLTEVFFNYFGNVVVMLVACLAMSEECFGVFCRTARNGAFGRKGAIAEPLDVIVINQLGNLVLVNQFNLLVFVRCAESVEEVHERYACTECCQVGNGCEVHHLLHRTRTEHGETRLSAGHNVGVVAKDTQSVRSDGASRHVEHAR